MKRRNFVTCFSYLHAELAIKPVWATVITLASIYAQKVMGFGVKDTIVLVLIVNVTACIGAFAFGYVQDAIGKKRVDAHACGLDGMVVMAWFATTRPLFWIAANLAGLVHGLQPMAGGHWRSFFAPGKGRRRCSAFSAWPRGWLQSQGHSHGTVSWVTNNNHRLAMLVTGVFFIAAIAVLAQGTPARAGLQPRQNSTMQKRIIKFSGVSRTRANRKSSPAHMKAVAKPWSPARRSGFECTARYGTRRTVDPAARAS